MVKNLKNKKAYVGMSGGVDSSVSAYLLKKSGYDVTGVFIKVWQPEGIECTWKEDRLDAMRVAAELDIPFITIDLEKEYKQGVIDYMIEEYKSGRTPNPDVMCNKHVKFGAFFKWAVEQGADFVATGHYTQNIFNKEKGLFELRASKDEAKDQGYFLWTISQNELERTLFPVGGMTKSEVRAIAQKANLYTKDKKDSQGLCFIGKLDIKDFLKGYIAESVGKVLNQDGEIIGEHPGTMFFTLGERHGFTITVKSNHDNAYFIVAKDIEKNILIVSDRVDKNNNEYSIKLTSTNWISKNPLLGKEYLARFRHGGVMHKCKFLEVGEGDALILLDSNDFSISKGQSLVVFDGEVLLGGGIIS